MMKILTQEDWNKSSQVHLQDGIEPEKEAKIRNQASKFITEFGFVVNKLPLNTILKALVIFQRFSTQVSFKKFDLKLYGAASLFLAAKDDDCPKEIVQYIKKFLLYKEIQQQQSQGRSKEESKSFSQQFQETLEEQTIENCKKQILDAESNLLKLSGYDLEIQLTTKYINQFQTSEFFPQSQEGDKFLKLMYNFQSDFYRSKLCLYYEPHILALCIIEMTIATSKIPPNNIPGKPWFKIFDPSVEVSDLSVPCEAFKEFLNLLRSSK